jgi:hypothetical protein
MTNENITQSLKRAIKDEVQDNLELITIIFNPLFESGFQINYYYKYASITEENLESVSCIETEIYSDVSSDQINEFLIRSAIYQNKFPLLKNEVVVYDSSIDKL